MCIYSVGQWLDVILLPAKSVHHSTYLAAITGSQQSPSITFPERGQIRPNKGHKDV